MSFLVLFVFCLREGSGGFRAWGLFPQNGPYGREIRYGKWGLFLIRLPVLCGGEKLYGRTLKLELPMHILRFDI